MPHGSQGGALGVQRWAILLGKVLYASVHPYARAPECGLPQQCHQRPAVWRNGVMSGRGLQAHIGASPHASPGGHYLREQSYLVHFMDRPVLPPRGGELCIEIIGAQSFSRTQGRTAAPLPIASTPIVVWGTHRASKRPSGPRW